jgi:DNA-binding NtrC family response regulator
MENSAIKVLVMDDDAEYTGILTHHLHGFQGTNFEVLVARNGDELTKSLEKNPNIDVILMDYYLPEGNGLEVARRVTEQGIKIPIILLTSSKDFRVAIEAMKYGVEEYLVKEEAVDTVLPRTISNVVERARIKRKIETAEHEKLISQKRAEAIRELVVTMCHEFNNPLAAIKISADILARQKIAPEEKKLLHDLDSSIALLEKQILKLRDMNVSEPEKTGAGNPEG